MTSAVNIWTSGMKAELCLQLKNNTNNIRREEDELNLLALVLFQIRKTFVHLCKINEDIFNKMSDFSSSIDTTTMMLQKVHKDFVKVVPCTV